MIQFEHIFQAGWNLAEESSAKDSGCLGCIGVAFSSRKRWKIVQLESSALRRNFKNLGSIGDYTTHVYRAYRLYKKSFSASLLSEQYICPRWCERKGGAKRYQEFLIVGSNIGM